MPLPTSKDELLQTMRTAYERLDSEIACLPQKHERDTSIKGNLSCCDLIAYQIGWANLLLAWEAQEKNGTEPEMPSKGFKWNQLGELAKVFYRESEKKSLSDLRKEFAHVFDELVHWIESLSEKELLEPHQRQWTGDKWNMIKWIQVNTVAPYKSARTKIRRWKKRCEIQSSRHPVSATVVSQKERI